MVQLPTSTILVYVANNNYQHSSFGGCCTDVILIDGKPLYAGKNNTTVTNPLLIVEVLSKSTKNYDQGDKFTFYRSIPQFKEYVLVEQNQYQVMHYSKTNEGEWIFREDKSEDDIVKLQYLEFEIGLIDIYQDVNFEDKE